MKLACVLAVCVVVLSGCTLFGIREPLSVTIADLKPIEIGVLEQRYAMKVRVLNPNDTEIAFDGVVFELEINGVPFAKGVTDQASVVPRFGEALIDVQLVSGLQNILRQINELTKGERTSLSYRIRGRLYYKGAFGFVSFDSSGEIALPPAGGKPRS
jgi:LEA14-like dessication related protein